MLIGSVLLTVAPTRRAALDLPSLGWIQEGKTFWYQVDDGNQTTEFNATITEVTTDHVKYEYWDVVNGSKQTFDVHWTSQEREDVNHTDPQAYTFQFVNETNVNELGYATIGVDRYDYAEDLSTDEILVFIDGNETWKFDRDNGWLVEHHNSSLESTWSLVDHDVTLTDPETVDPNLDQRYCDENDDLQQTDDWENVRHNETDVNRDNLQQDPAELEMVGLTCWDKKADGDCTAKVVTAIKIQFVESIYWDHAARLEYYEADNLVDEELFPWIGPLGATGSYSAAKELTDGPTPIPIIDKILVKEDREVLEGVEMQPTVGYLERANDNDDPVSDFWEVHC